MNREEEEAEENKITLSLSVLKMGTSKLLLLTIIFTLVFVIRDDSGVNTDDDSSLIIELDQLKSKISLLESSILRLEEVIQQKSLQTDDVTSLHKKVNVETAEQVGKAHARPGKLEKQVEKPKNEKESQGAKRSALETRATEAENKLNDFNLKLENVHSAWFPRLATHLVHTQSYIVTNWNKHGKPALDVAIEKALEKKNQAQKLAEPHVESVKTKFVPAIKEKWVTVTTYAEPHVQTLTTKTVEVYESSKKTVAPHVEKAQKIVDPYLQEVKKISKPYIDQVATTAKPLVDKSTDCIEALDSTSSSCLHRFLKSVRSKLLSTNAK